MYPRTLARTIHTVSAAFPVLLVTGPRQVGKTTLLEMCAQAAPDTPRAYVTLDDLDARALAQSDPALFLQTWPAPVIIDEIQYAPQLFSAIKRQVDRAQTNGQFWLTGSQKFALMRGISETLAGRVAIKSRKPPHPRTMPSDISRSWPSWESLSAPVPCCVL